MSPFCKVLAPIPYAEEILYNIELEIATDICTFVYCCRDDTPDTSAPTLVNGPWQLVMEGEGEKKLPDWKANDVSYMYILLDLCQN